MTREVNYASNGKMYGRGKSSSTRWAKRKNNKHSWFKRARRAMKISLNRT